MSNEATQMNAPSGGIAGLRPMLLLLGVAVAVAAGVGIALWSQEPTYKLLAPNLADADLGEVTASLNQAGILYKIDGSSVLVPADRYADARMKTAGKGLSAAGGFASLEKDPGFGVSQFMENARYQHALQQELEQVIAGLDSVQQASVILAVPQQSAFVRDRRRVSASVTLQLRAGRRLDREQVNSIVNLVASSVPELTADEVTVVDSQGRLLSSPDKNNEFAARDQQLDLARRMGDEYSQRIESLLTPLLGPGRVRASVVAQLEMSTTEEAREQYKPDSQVVRSEQTSEEQSRSGAGAQGVPGALTNQPPEGGTVQPPGAATAAKAAPAADATQAAAAPGNASKQATRNYEIDRTVAYTRQPAGRLQRLSVAVLIDNLRSTAADGKVTETPINEEQLGRINTLVRDAVGFDEARGDRVSVINQSFLPEAAAAAPELAKASLWDKPLVRDIVKLVAGLVVLVLLLLLVVRPLVKSLSAAAKQLMEPPRLAAAGAGGAESGAASRPGTAIAYEQQIAQARSLVAKDPARVAQVVKEWVQKDE
ncbi:MAG: flagellar basal-body MS-ring/collar protein FliF [Steroidobacteraceae bacterium]